MDNVHFLFPYYQSPPLLQTARRHKFSLFFDCDAQTQHGALNNFLQVLKHLGPGTIITHEVSAQTAGNLIGQRDFLSVRHSCKHDSSLYLGGTAIQLESFPPQAGFVR